MTRTTKWIVKLAAATVLVATGSGMALWAEPTQAVGTWVSMGAFAHPRTGAAAVALDDGRTLMAGGVTDDGTPTDSVIIYDPISNTSSSSGHLLAARVGHTATLLSDGRVLVAGGTVDGFISADIEVFDPTSGSSTLVASMAQPRTRHAAAKLGDGSVLLVGGSTADGAVLASAEKFDASTGGVTPIAGSLQVARTGASATTLIDGRVLVTGGNDGAQDVASAEMFTPFDESFSPVDTQLSMARSGHTAVLLPHNNSVLIAGGTSAGAPATAADLFLPAEFPDPYSWGMGRFAATGSMTAARSDAVGGPVGDNGYAFVAGGGSGAADVYRFATIKTDKNDYAPGERAVITGSGWQPGAPVTLVFQEDPAVHDDYTLTVTADAEGNIAYDQWTPESHDFGVRFYLLAHDSRSRAQITFTDGGTLTLVIQGSGSGTVLANGAGINNFSCTTATSPCSKATNSNGNVTVTATAASGSGFAGWSGACTGTGTCVVSMNGNNVTPSVTATFNAAQSNQTITVTTPAPANAPYNATFSVAATASSGLPVTIASSGACTGSGSASAAITMTSGIGSCVVTYSQGGNATYNAAPNVTSNTAAEKATPTITWSNPPDIVYGTALSAAQLNATTSGDGELTYTPAAGTVLDAGSHTLTVNAAATDNYNAASKSVSLTVNKADQTITWSDPAAITYGTALSAAQLNATTSGDGELSYTPAAGTVLDAGSHTLTVNAAATNNYNAASKSVSLTVNKADQTITWSDPAAITYGTALSDAQLNATSSGDGALTYTPAAGTVLDAGSHTLTVNAAATNNYNPASKSVSLTVNKADQTVTFNPLPSKTYGDLPFSVSASASSNLVVAFTASGKCTISGTTITLTGAGSCTVTASQDGNSNFNLAPSVAQTFTIAKKHLKVTVTDATKFYGAPNPAFEVVYSDGFVNNENSSALSGALNFTTTATTGTHVGQYDVFASGLISADYEFEYIKGTLTIIYNTADGHQFLQPINLTTPRSAFKAGSTIPAKFRLFMADKTTPVSTAVAQLQVTLVSASCPSAVNEDSTVVAADAGTTFRYDAIGQQYIFNLGTDKSWCGIYGLTAKLDDGGQIYATVEVRNR